MTVENAAYFYKVYQQTLTEVYGFYKSIPCPACLQHVKSSSSLNYGICLRPHFAQTNVLSSVFPNKVEKAKDESQEVIIRSKMSSQGTVSGE